MLTHFRRLFNVDENQRPKIDLVLVKNCIIRIDSICCQFPRTYFDGKSIPISRLLLVERTGRFGVIGRQADINSEPTQFTDISLHFNLEKFRDHSELLYVYLYSCLEKFQALQAFKILSSYTYALIGTWKNYKFSYTYLQWDLEKFQPLPYASIRTWKIRVLLCTPLFGLGRMQLLLHEYFPQNRRNSSTYT